MTMRVWTREELDQVWPLPEGWRWERWVSLWTAVGRDGCSVVVHDDGDVHLETEYAPAAVVLAVIGAHLGHDSPEWMAKAMGLAAAANMEDAWTAKSEWADGHAQGCSEAYEECAALLRRGRVQDRDPAAARRGHADLAKPNTGAAPVEESDGEP